MLHTCTESWIRLSLLLGFAPRHQFVRESILDGGQFFDSGTACLHLEKRGNKEGREGKQG